jgi:hypothetical protein
MGQALAMLGVEPDADEQKCFPFIAKKYDPNDVHPKPDGDIVEPRPSPLSPGLADRSIVGKGLFAATNIPSDTVVCQFDPFANDCMIDISDVINATTSQQAFDALAECRKKYYDYDEVAKNVNVCVMTIDGIPWLVSTRFIAKGEEIKRIYGFSTWLKELPEINVLTCATARGVLDYIADVQAQKPHDHYIAYCAKIASKRDEIIAFLDACDDQTSKISWRFGGNQNDPMIDITVSPAASKPIDSNTILPPNKRIIF